MSTSTPFPKRPKWPFIAAGVVALLVAALIGGWLLGRDQGGTPPGTPTTPSQTDPVDEDGQVNGCLGGPDRTPDMVLAAQEETDIASDEDGVAFSAALARWLMQAPPVPAADDQLAALTAPDADPSVQEALEGSSSGTDAENSSWGSTTGGRWYIESTSAEGLVVSLSLLPVTNGELDEDSRILVTVSLSRADGVWAWSGFEMQVRGADEMEEIGSVFTESCG